MPHLWVEPVEQHQDTEPGPNLSLSLSLPVYACLCLGLWLRSAPIALPHQHIYCTCLLASCHPHTQFPFIYPENLVEGRKKSLKSIEKDYSSWGQACLTSTENTHSYPERHTYTVPLIQPAGCPAQAHQQVSLKATDSVVGHQSISSFSSTERIWGSWETPCLKWYLCATAFFTVLSWLELHNKKKQEHGHKASATTPIMSHIHANYHCYLCLISECTILWLFIATVSS